MKNIETHGISFTFFGSSRFSTIVLDELKALGLLPTEIITTPDKPQGRKMEMTPNVVKTWAVKNGVSCIDAPKLDEQTAGRFKSSDIFIVASYGKIIPARILEIPPHKTLNIHPSLLPKYRGPSPLPSVILADDKHTGVTIMRLDEQMDHGPIVAQKEIPVPEWPPYDDFEEMMAKAGARLLADILLDWVSGKIKEIPQNHDLATYTSKVSKEDGLIELDSDPYLNFRKIRAYSTWPQAYFFIDHRGNKIRVKVTKASFKDSRLNIEKVIPEGGKEMDYADFLRGYAAR